VITLFYPYQILNELDEGFYQIDLKFSQVT